MTPVTLKMLRCSFTSLFRSATTERDTHVLAEESVKSWFKTTKNSVSKEHQTMALPVSIQGFYTIVLIIFVRHFFIML